MSGTLNSIIIVRMTVDRNNQMELAMQKNLYFIILIMMLMIVGCENRKDYNSMTSDQIIAEIENEMKPYSWPIDDRILVKVSRKIIEDISNPETLGQVLKKAYTQQICIDKGKHFFQHLNYCFGSKIFFTLAEINTVASAEVLVDLLFDPDLSWDGELMLSIKHCISKCGKKALPFMKDKIKNVKDDEKIGYDSLIEYLEQGKIYGP